MEFNLTTFILEIINFLVLIWILKKFLYKPVLDVIAKRRELVEQTVLQSEQLKEQAEFTKDQYESRLNDWEKELHIKREALSSEIHQEREKRLVELEQLLTNEKKKEIVKQEKAQNRIIRDIEVRALQQGAEFATHILSQVAGTDLEAKLSQLVISQSNSLSSEQLSALRQRWKPPLNAVKVYSAFPLPEQLKTRLTETVFKIIGQSIPVDFELDSELLAGLRMELGSWSLGLNIRDELKGFAEIHHVG